MRTSEAPNYVFEIIAKEQKTLKDIKILYSIAASLFESDGSPVLGAFSTFIVLQHVLPSELVAIVKERTRLTFNLIRGINGSPDATYQAAVAAHGELAKHAPSLHESLRKYLLANIDYSEYLFHTTKRLSNTEECRGYYQRLKAQFPGTFPLSWEDFAATYLQRSENRQVE